MQFPGQLLQIGNLLLDLGKMCRGDRVDLRAWPRLAALHPGAGNSPIFLRYRMVTTSVPVFRA